MRPSVPVANRPSAKPSGGSYNRPGTSPRAKPKPKPPVVSTPKPKLPSPGQARPGRPRSNFVPGRVTYPGQITSSAKRPNPKHPARSGNRPQPRPLNQVIGSNVNSNNTRISNTNVSNTTINHIHNTNYNRWVNNNTTIWNPRRVVNNRPVHVNANFQRSVNYAYRPTSWGGRPWWSSSTYHHWHHGSWNYGWNRSWERYHSYYRPSYGPSYYLPGYRPAPSYRSTVSWGIAAWTLGSLAYELGYNSYRNPYSAPPVQTRTTVINYTQPLSVVASREEPEPEAAALTSEEKSSAATALARAAFRNGDYLGALKSTDEAISYAPGDSALHEFRALCLFALARYGDAAGVLNPVLASGPGWDWATMSDFYADGEVYTAQLRKLEDYVGARPDGADAHFVLGYHYMVGGFIDEAYAMFDRVTELQPADTVASQLRDLAESSSASADEGSELEEAVAPESVPEDLVLVPLDPTDIEGSWKAPSSDGKSITLALGADGQFSWNYDGADEGTVLEGEWSIDDESRLVLSAGDVQMVAEVSLDGDTLQFVLAGSPVGDPGLLFERR